MKKKELKLELEWNSNEGCCPLVGQGVSENEDPTQDSLSKGKIDDMHLLGIFQWGRGVQEKSKT